MLFDRYNGSLPNGDRGRRKSRFALFKRPKANGVKPSTVHIACTPQAAKVSSISPSKSLISPCAILRSIRKWFKQHKYPAVKRMVCVYSMFFLVPVGVSKKQFSKEDSVCSPFLGLKKKVLKVLKNECSGHRIVI